MTRPDPSKIIVPRKHGEILIEPSLRDLAEACAAGPSSAFPKIDAVMGESFGELRRMARTQMLGAARDWMGQFGEELPSDDVLARRWVVTGHQLEFYHAGVWAKVLAADELARRLPVDPGACAFDLLVDHDLVDRHGFDVPRRQNSRWTRVPVDFAESTALPVSDLMAPDQASFDRWDAALAEIPATRTDSMTFFLAALRRLRFTDGSPVPYARWLSRARVRFERSLGLMVHHVPATQVCAGAAWDAFVRAWITHADAWTSAYNRFLGDYRRRQGIKGRHHPMPDLARDSAGVELPFWVHRAGRPRVRMVIAPGVGDTAVLLEDGPRPITPDLQIRPRALTLTMFVRLFLADVFIHGIGGALYDQITDAMLQEFFGAAPAYGCVSAAWLLPLGQAIPQGEDVAALRWRRHYVVNNPHLALDPFTVRRPEVVNLIRERQSLVSRIAESLETARGDPEARRQRQTWFNALHEINRQLHAQAPRMLPNLVGEIEEARLAAAENRVLQWREYFFGLHVTDSLRQLVERIRAR